MFSLIANANLNLPNGRNSGGQSALNDSFSNSQGYTSYLLIFPSVKTIATNNDHNSMQIAEAQLFGTKVPEPTTLALMGLSLCDLRLGYKRKG